jgi:hypothetical protein
MKPPWLPEPSPVRARCRRGAIWTIIVRLFPARLQALQTLVLQTSRTFGSTRRSVASVGQGSWKIEESEADSDITTLSRGIDLGLNQIDTHEIYR